MRPTINPDLLRYWWVELTPRRLLTAVISILAIAGLVYTTQQQTADAALINTGREELLPFPAVMLFINAIVFGYWGTRTIVSSVVDEVQDGLWDIHRLGGLTSLQMVTGRLFGACGLVWVAGLLLSGMYVLQGACETDAEISALLIRAAVMLLVGLAVLSASLAQSLMMVAMSWRRQGHFLAQLAGMGVLVFLAKKFEIIDFLLNVEEPRISLPIAQTGQAWFGRFISQEAYFLAVAGGMALVLTVGAWRAMYRARHIPPPPWGLPIGGLLLAGLLACHDIGIAPWQGGLSYGHVVIALIWTGWGIIYSVMFGQNNLLLLQRSFAVQSGARQWAQVPGWLPLILAYTILCCVLATLQPVQVPQPQTTVPPQWLILMSIPWVVRDILLVMVLSTRGYRSSGLASLAIIFGVMFVLGMLAHKEGADQISVLFIWPWMPNLNHADADMVQGISRVPWSILWTGIIAVTIQIVMMVLWLWWSVRQERHRQIVTTPS